MRPDWMLIALIVLSLSSGSALAASANVIQSLNFGKWHVPTNHTAYSITVNADGTYSYSPQLVMIQPPRQGIYTVTGLALSYAITGVNVTQIQPMQGGGAEDFEMTSFDVDYPPSTDGAGTAQISIGATASTSGSGSGYGTDVLTGHLNIQVNY